MEVKVQLPNGWSDHSRENPGTYLRDDSAVPGPLQVSVALYEGGEIPNPSEQDLVDMCRELGAQQNCGEALETGSGRCVFGNFGTAVFRTAEDPRIQLWRLSNGRDFVLVTHICPAEPDAKEVAEADQIVQSLTLEPAPKSKWKFW